jgi:hypothetical protein
MVMVALGGTGNPGLVMTLLLTVTRPLLIQDWISFLLCCGWSCWQKASRRCLPPPLLLLLLLVKVVVLVVTGSGLLKALVWLALRDTA